MKKRFPVLLVSGAALAAALLGLWVTVWAISNVQPPAPPGAKVVNVRVEVIEPRKGVTDNTELAAVLEPLRTVTVSAEVAGRVESIECSEGKACKAGDPLLKLNTDLLKADLDRATAQHKLAGASFERVKKLHDADVARQEQLDNARAALDGAKAALDAANARWKRAQILAPVSGILDEAMVEKGEYVGPGTPVARIVDSSKVKAVVMVPEKDVTCVAVGKNAGVIVRTGGEDGEPPLVGKITYISQLADRRTRATRVEVTVDNPGGRLRAGLIATVRLERRKLASAIMVPLGAVIPMERGHSVYVAVESRDLRLTALCAGMNAAQVDEQVGAPLRRALQKVSGVEKVDFSAREVQLKVDPRLEPASPMPPDARARITAALKSHPKAKVNVKPPIKSVVVCELAVHFVESADMGAAYKAVNAALEPVRSELAGSVVLGGLESGTVAVRRAVKVDTSLIESYDKDGAVEGDAGDRERQVEQYVRVSGGLKPGDRLIVAGQRFVGPGQPVRIEKPGGKGAVDSDSGVDAEEGSLRK